MKKVIFSLMFCLMTYTVAAANFHAFVIRSTLRSNILRHEQKKDVKRVLANLSVISQSTGLNLNVKTITTKKLSKDKFYDWLKDCDITEDDCLLIYFTGLAFCPDKNKSKWPTIYCEQAKAGLQFSRIEEAIDNIEPRLAIVLYDAVNYDFEMPMQPTTPDFVEINSNVKELRDLSNARSLFLQVKGKIFVASASPGDLKYSNKDGSIFSRFFFNSLQQEASQPNPSWENVIRNFKEQYSVTKQTPLIQLSLE